MIAHLSHHSNSLSRVNDWLIVVIAKPAKPCTNVLGVPSIMINMGFENRVNKLYVLLLDLLVEMKDHIVSIEYNKRPKSSSSMNMHSYINLKY